MCYKRLQDLIMCQNITSFETFRNPSCGYPDHRDESRNLSSHVGSVANQRAWVELPWHASNHLYKMSVPSALLLFSNLQDLLLVFWKNKNTCIRQVPGGRHSEAENLHGMTIFIYFLWTSGLQLYTVPNHQAAMVHPCPLPTQQPAVLSTDLFGSSVRLKHQSLMRSSGTKSWHQAYPTHSGFREDIWTPENIKWSEPWSPGALGCFHILTRVFSCVSCVFSVFKMFEAKPPELRETSSAQTAQTASRPPDAIGCHRVRIFHPTRSTPGARTGTPWPQTWPTQHHRGG